MMTALRDSTWQVDSLSQPSRSHALGRQFHLGAEMYIDGGFQGASRSEIGILRDFSWCGRRERSQPIIGTKQYEQTFQWSGTRNPY